MVGVGWRIYHRPIQVSTHQLRGRAYSSTLAACARWACDQGDKVVNIPYSGAESQSRRDAASYCRSKGSLVFNSAGNGARDISGYDADADDLIVVGATDRNDARTWWSNYGSYVDIMAPGYRVLTTTASNWGYFSGTSFSCALASGLAALIWSVNPRLTADEVEKVIKEGATDLGAAGKRISAYGAISHHLVTPPPPAPSPVPPPPSPNCSWCRCDWSCLWPDWPW